MAALAGRAGKFFRQPPKLCRLTLTAALLAAFGLHQYRAWQEDSAEGPSLPSNVELVMHELTATRSAAGALQWRLSARQAGQTMHEDSTLLEGVHMLLKDRQGKEIVITADSGTLLAHGDAVSAQSNVEILLPDATRLYTEALVYDAGRDLITSTDPVRIDAGKIQTTGMGMQIELSKRRFTLQDRVRAVAQP